MKFLPLRLAVWLITLVIFPIPASLIPRSFQLEVLERITLSALPPEEPASVDLTERVLLRLENFEKREIDPWYRDDIRVAWITTKWAQSGVPEWSWHRDAGAFVAATYQVLNCHPDQVWPRIVERRKRMLKAEYADFFPHDASSPKKPCVSVGLKRNRKVA